MKKQEFIYLSKADLQSIDLKIDDAIHSLERGYQAKAEGLTEDVPKARIHLQGDNNIINAIPAYTPNFNLAGLKWISTFPGNLRIGLPDVSGLIILSDVETGCPLAMMDSTMITDLHSSATILYSAERLAIADSSVLSVVGCNSSIIEPVEALNSRYDFLEILLYDNDKNSVKSVADELSIRAGKNVQIVENFRETIERSDIIITARSIAEKSIGAIQAGWLKEGAFIIMVDPYCYLHSDALQEVSKIYTEETKQLCQYKDAGYFKELTDIYADLIDLAGKKRQVRESPKERIIYINLAWGINNLIIADLIYRRALKKGVGVRLSI
jgi:ornithine cyclodeaminase/alanine dehydrogenase-like protein (mu-crystallin family)